MRRQCRPGAVRLAPVAQRRLAALRVAPSWLPSRTHAAAAAAAAAQPSASPATPDLGIVASVAGITATTVKGFQRDARVHSLVTFQCGGSGFITALQSDGAARVATLRGPILARETAVIEQGAVSIPVGPALLGRVVDPLGDPLDGRGPLDTRAPPAVAAATGVLAPLPLPRPEPLFSSPSPPAIERLPRGSCRLLPTGHKAVDAFTPVLRGHSVVVSGEGAATRRAFALDALTLAVADARSGGALLSTSAVSGDDAVRPVIGVYVTVGCSPASLKTLVDSLAAAGVLQHSVIIAAPEGCSPGLAYAAPFAGAAVSSYWRGAGADAVLVVDDLKEHIKATKAVTGTEYFRITSAPTMYGALFDRCGALQPSAGGGSLTLLALMDAPSGAGMSSGSGGLVVSMEDVQFKAAMEDVASMVDLHLPLSSRAAAAGAVFPLAFEELGTAASPHAAQGQALRHYAARSQVLLSQLREAARAVVRAEQYGVEAEADTDAVLDLHAKARLSLCPTAAALEAVAAVPGEAAGLSPERVAKLGLAGLDYLSSSERKEMAAAGIAAADVEEAASGAAGGAPARPGEMKARVSQLASSLGFALPTAGVRPPKPLPAPPKPQPAPAQPQPAATGAAAPAPAAASSSAAAAAAPATSLVDKMDASQRAALAAMQAARAAKGGKAASLAAAYGFGVKKAAAGAGAAAPAAAPQPAPKAVVKAAAPIASEPAAEAASPEDAAAAERSARLPFRAPEGRTRPSPLLDSTDATQRAGDVFSTASALLSRPAHGDLGRLFVSLFVLAHGYASRVPLHRYPEYEAALTALLSKAPAPPTQGSEAPESLLQAVLAAPVPDTMVEVGSRPGDIAGVLRVSNAALAGIGRFRAMGATPADDVEPEAPPPAAPSLPVVDAAAVRVPSPSLWTMVKRAFGSQESTSSSSKAAAAAPPPPPEEPPAPVVVAEPEPSAPALPVPLHPLGLWGHLRLDRPFTPVVLETKEKKAAVEAAAPEGEESSPAPARVRAVSRRSLAVEPALPPVWLALHTTVAAFTRQFCGEPEAPPPLRQL